MLMQFRGDTDDAYSKEDFDAETSVKLINAYFCTGSTNWVSRDLRNCSKLKIIEYCYLMQLYFQYDEIKNTKLKFILYLDLLLICDAESNLSASQQLHKIHRIVQEGTFSFL